MIDHVSIGVRNLDVCARFYEPVLAALGYGRLVSRPGAIGFGKKYPEFWLNQRRAMPATELDNGAHVCLRASSVEAVQAFHTAALAGGGESDGAPGPRSGHIGGYYAAFIRDIEGNKIEAATFASPQP
ncbi:MAG: VOC family protein [Hyphomicrobiales bacterium]|nr:VOC family protein [Alphaproteobacteria bacterium]